MTLNGIVFWTALLFAVAQPKLTIFKDLSGFAALQGNYIVVRDRDAAFFYLDGGTLIAKASGVSEMAVGRRFFWYISRRHTRMLCRIEISTRAKRLCVPARGAMHLHYAVGATYFWVASLLGSANTRANSYDLYRVGDDGKSQPVFTGESVTSELGPPTWCSGPFVEYAFRLRGEEHLAGFTLPFVTPRSSTDRSNTICASDGTVAAALIGGVLYENGDKTEISGSYDALYSFRNGWLLENERSFSILTRWGSELAHGDKPAWSMPYDGLRFYAYTPADLNSRERPRAPLALLERASQRALALFAGIYNFAAFDGAHVVIRHPAQASFYDRNGELISFVPFTSDVTVGRRYFWYISSYADPTKLCRMAIQRNATPECEAVQDGAWDLHYADGAVYFWSRSVRSSEDAPRGLPSYDLYRVAEVPGSVPGIFGLAPAYADGKPPKWCDGPFLEYATSYGGKKHFHGFVSPFELALPDGREGPNDMCASDGRSVASITGGEFYIGDVKIGQSSNLSAVYSFQGGWLLERAFSFSIFDERGAHELASGETPGLFMPYDGLQFYLYTVTGYDSMYGPLPPQP